MANQGARRRLLNIEEVRDDNDLVDQEFAPNANSSYTIIGLKIGRVVMVKVRRFEVQNNQWVANLFPAEVRANLVDQVVRLISERWGETPHLSNPQHNELANLIARDENALTAQNILNQHARWMDVLALKIVRRILALARNDITIENIIGVMFRAGRAQRADTEAYLEIIRALPVGIVPNNDPIINRAFWTAQMITPNFAREQEVLDQPNPAENRAREEQRMDIEPAMDDHHQPQVQGVGGQDDFAFRARINEAREMFVNAGFPLQFNENHYNHLQNVDQIIPEAQRRINLLLGARAAQALQPQLPIRQPPAPQPMDQENVIWDRHDDGGLLRDLRNDWGENARVRFARQGADVARQGYINVPLGQGFGAIPLRDDIRAYERDEILRQELQGYPSKQESNLRLTSQFDGLVKSTMSIVNTELYRKRELLVSYKAKVVLHAFDILKQRLNQHKVKLPMTKYYFPRAWDTYRLGPLFANVTFYPVHFRLKFDKDMNPLITAANETSKFGIYLGYVQAQAFQMTKIIPFGKKRKTTYDFKLAPYYGYVDSMFSLLRQQSALQALPLTFFVPPLAADRLGENYLAAPGGSNGFGTLAGSEIGENSKISVWLAKESEDNRPILPSIRNFLGTEANWPAINAKIVRLGQDLGYDAGAVQAASNRYQGIYDAQNAEARPDFIRSIPFTLIRDLANNPNEVILERRMKVSRVNAAPIQCNTEGELIAAFAERLGAYANDVVAWWKDRAPAALQQDAQGNAIVNIADIPDPDCVLHIQHNRANIAYPEGDQRRLRLYYQQAVGNIPCSFMGSGFVRFDIFVRYVALLSWVRNFLYSIKQEKTKISQQRVRNYVKNDSKSLQKLIYTFGGEPSKVVSYR